MAVSTSITHSGVPGDAKIAVVEVTLDDSYPTGGEAIAWATVLDAYRIIAVGVLNSSSANGYVPQWDVANSKVLMYEAGADGAALDEVANTTDLSAETITFWVMYV